MNALGGMLLFLLFATFLLSVVLQPVFNFAGTLRWISAEQKVYQKAGLGKVPMNFSQWQFCFYFSPRWLYLSTNLFLSHAKTWDVNSNEWHIQFLMGMLAEYGRGYGGRQPDDGPLTLRGLCVEIIPDETMKGYPDMLAAIQNLDIPGFEGHLKDYPRPVYDNSNLKMWTLVFNAWGVTKTTKGGTDIDVDKGKWVHRSNFFYNLYNIPPYSDLVWGFMTQSADGAHTSLWRDNREIFPWMMDNLLSINTGVRTFGGGWAGYVKEAGSWGGNGVLSVVDYTFTSQLRPFESQKECDAMAAAGVPAVNGAVFGAFLLMSIWPAASPLLMALSGGFLGFVGGGVQGAVSQTC
jgi:hypothetical protein